MHKSYKENYSRFIMSNGGSSGGYGVNADWDLVEEDLFKLSHEKKPIFTNRSDKGFTINSQLSNRLTQTLNKIKGQITTEISESGDLEINEFIRYKVDKRAKTIQNLEFFEEESEKNGIDIILLIDCSGSMSRLNQKLADLSASIFQALEKSDQVNFKVIAFSAKSHDYQHVVEIIDKKEKCGRIHADFEDYHDNHNLNINYAVEEILKTNSDNKKLILMITDGYPEIVWTIDRDYTGRSRSLKKGMRLKFENSDIPRNLMERSVIEAKNQEIPIFCIWFNHIEDTVKPMRKLFRGMLYETQNFDQVEKVLIQKLTESIEKLNQGNLN